MIGIWRTGQRGAGHTLTAVLLALALLGFPTYMIAHSLNQPQLNDISTDIDSPPGFSSDPKIIAARGGFMPPAMGRSQREAQVHAYPDVLPITLDIDAIEAFRVVEAAIKALAWKEIDAMAPVPERADGRIEVQSRSLLMGVPYTISIRIRPVGEGTRVDIRSLSRLGAHDFGANAERIRNFADALQSEMDSR